jgi:hypothetical protein
MIVNNYPKNNGIRPKVLSVNDAGIPENLKALKQWCVWRYEYRDGKYTKVPYSLAVDINGCNRRAKSNDPATWSNFEPIVSAYRAPKSLFDGIGFFLTPPYVGIDWDKCRNEDGSIVPLAEINSLETYAELSPSGKGVKAIAKGKIPYSFNNRTSRVEIYNKTRFFALTGRVLSQECQVITAPQERLAALWERYELPEAIEVDCDIDEAEAPPSEGDQALIAKAKAAKNGAKFEKLWEGDYSDYGSHSEADLALVSILRYWTEGNTAWLDRLFRQSGLMRDKWERRDYRDRLVAKALATLKSQDKAEYDLPTDEEVEAAISEDDTVEKETELMTWKQIKEAARSKQPFWVIDGLIACGEVSMPCSLPWAGKSSQLGKMVSCVALGLPWFDYATSPVPIIYINADRNSYDLFARRIAVHVKGGDDWLNKYLFMPRLEKMPTPMPKDKIISYIKAVKRHTGCDKAWVIVDTIRSAFLSGHAAGGENDPTTMVNVITPLRQIALTENCAITIPHHCAKSSDSYAGTAAIAGMVDTFIQITRPMDSHVAELKIQTRRGINSRFFVEQNPDLSLVKIDGHNSEPEVLAAFLKPCSIKEALVEINKGDIKMSQATLYRRVKEFVEAGALIMINEGTYQFSSK